MRRNLIFRMVIVFQVMWNAFGWKYELLPTKVNSEALSDKVQHNISITETGGLSLYINLLEDLHDLFMTVNLAMNLDLEKNYNVDVIKRTVNCCQLFKNPSYASEVQFFYKIMLERGHFPVQCPVKKDLYYFEDLRIDPEMLPEVMGETNAFMTIKFSVRERKKFKNLATYQLYFTVHKIGNESH